ncbi:MAG TPA: multiheme c-type cytochrome [Candidatus Polarisedimenticolia bacterium]|jgi:hypothetical protein|nr:multiheme c-type cytochrome [Candidatus Polarisedimenticolia bacterium]
MSHGCAGTPFVLLPLVALCLPPLMTGACRRAPAVAFTVSPSSGGGPPDRLAVKMDMRGVPRGGIDLRGFAAMNVMKVADLTATAEDGTALPVLAGTETARLDRRTLDLPRFILRGPLPPSISVRYTVEPGSREGDAHMGFTGRSYGYLGNEFGFVVGRGVFLLPDRAESLRDITVRFVDWPAGWTAVVPFRQDGDAWRPGVDGAYAAEHLVSAAIGLGRFRERTFDAGATRVSLDFESAIPTGEQAAIAASIEIAVRYLHGLFHRDLGPAYRIVILPRSPSGDAIAGEGWATGQGGTLAPLTAQRLRDLSASLIDAYVRHAPYRTELSRSEEFWLVDGVENLYSWRAAAAAGLVPEEEIARSLAISYMVSLGVQHIEPDLETIYSTPGPHRVETESRAPFALLHLDRELRSATQGAESLDAVVGRVFGTTGSSSFWPAVPEVRPGFKEEFRTRYVQGREMIPLARTYTLDLPRERPSPAAGPVVRRLTLLLTGDTQGYLENCGCKANQSGGVARRATALARLRAGQPGALLVDAGGAFIRPEKQIELDYLARQEQALYLKTLDMMGYQASAIGTTELTLGLDYFREQTRLLKTPYLAANILRDGRPIAPGSLVLRSGGIRLGLIGIFEPPAGKAAPGLFEENSRALTFADPIETLARETKALRGKADLVVALGRLSPYTARRAAATVAGLDAIVSSDNQALARQEDRSDHVHQEDGPGFIGRTLVAYSSLSRYGLVSVRLGLDAQGRIAAAEFEDHWLYEDTPDDPRVRRALDLFYDRVGKEAAAQESVPPLFAGDPARLNGTYVGAAACAECHAPEMAQWRRTPHASAFKTLLDRHRHFQPKCVACHVVGFGTPHGYRLGAPTEALANVQCEVCHGPGGEHATAPATTNIRRAVPASVCLECHTPDHSDHFVYNERLPKVKHDYFE